MDNQTEPSESIETPAADSIGTPNAEPAKAIETPSATTEKQGDALPAATDNSSDEEVYYDLDGEEVSKADVKKWKSGHMMQADYTQKTQKLSENSKKIEADRVVLDERLSLLTDMENELKDLVLGELKNVNLDTLLEEHPAEYLRTKDAIEKRNGTLTKIAEKRDAIRSELMQKGHQVLHENLGWNDSAKKEKDISAILKYVEESGMTQAEFNGITNPKITMAILEAAELRKLKTESATVAKKVTQMPRTGKPKAPTSSAPLSPEERMYGKSKR